jgi:hypothetical protein
MPAMVFISHSSKDRETAGAICNHVESPGFTFDGSKIIGVQLRILWPLVP